jgi:hypothetical protein
MTLAEPIAVMLAVTRALDRLEIRYLVGGSLASSVHGIPRSTQDLDLLLELPGALVGDPPEVVQVCSAEDIIVQKLDW